MIKINRRQSAPLIGIYTAPLDQNGHPTPTMAMSERNDAIIFFTDPNNFSNNKKLTKSPFQFTIYQDKELATELEKIFGKKCAYCESDFAAVTSAEIEHFRPKNQISTQDKKTLRPGYYWLAGDWLNLLVACPHCNRKVKHQVPGQPDKISLGKGTQFPLADETKRLRLHTCSEMQFKSEEDHRLLINPCIENPELYFTYDDDGLIHPKNSRNKKAVYSIHVYALQRKHLVEARKKKLVDLEEKLMNLEDPIIELDALDPREVARCTAKKQQIARLLGQVKKMLEPGEPYLGLLRDYIRRHVALGTYQRYRAAGIHIEALLDLPVSHPLPVPRLNLSTFRNMTSRIPVGLRLR
ncbi:hypothetical protein E0L21_15790 [Kosakonia quasisacchari]|uniref:HNH nuclease domain-containing protein n=1 Tax=Kosakonia quasisacchari TaxID=2529380 RepID=A0A4R0H2N5_9ENTR|nr:hypothetical protein [Kosakonia quasisacchari]TCC03454.1 hypothetical protein E0L21_15790 [Kosakonia quasisacchari]